MRAIAHLEKLIPRYRSKLEARWAQEGALVLQHDYGERVLLMLYEPLTFNLPGNNYTPDFMCILGDGKILFVETKGSRRAKNYRDARSKLRLAASVHSWATFIEARYNNGWLLEDILTT